MPSLIETLAWERALLCPACGSADLGSTASGFECAGCAAVWPVRNAVPDFFNRYLDHAGTNAGAAGSATTAARADVVDQIVHTLDLPEGPATTAKVAEILVRSAALGCDDAALTAEITDVIDRFAGSAAAIEQPAPADDTNLAPEVAFERHYFPSSMEAGTCGSANVRMRNVGRHPWSSRSADPLVVAASWKNDASPSGSTLLPIDIRPGRSISLPIPVQAPDRAGAHVLAVGLARQDSGERVGGVLEIPIRVRPARRGWRRYLPWPVPARLIGPPVECGAAIPDYGQDHADGVRMIESHFRTLGKPRYRALEIGSGTHPHLAWIDCCELVAVDISSPLLELGELYFRDRFRERLAFVCADAMHAPFRPESFDAVVIFSALHHFAEPERLLARMASLLKKDGFVAIMCEPVGSSLQEAPTIRDLLKGINEQVFSLPEYRRMFRQAGFGETRIRVDGGSLKAILHRPSPLWKTMLPLLRPQP